MSKKEILLIGAGNIGVYHLAALKRRKNINVSIVDVSIHKVRFLNDLMDTPQKTVEPGTINTKHFDYVILCLQPENRAEWLDLLSKNDGISVISEKPVLRGSQIAAVPYLKQFDYNRTCLKRKISSSISFPSDLLRLEYHLVAREASKEVLMDLYSHGLSVLMQILYDVGWNLIDARINDVSFNRNDLEVCFGLTNVVNGVENIVDINICLDNQAQHDFVIINENDTLLKRQFNQCEKDQHAS